MLALRMPLEFPPRNAQANMNASSTLPQRKIFGRLSIVVGNMFRLRESQPPVPLSRWRDPPIQDLSPSPQQ
jgi:hypothetical protein